MVLFHVKPMSEAQSSFRASVASPEAGESGPAGPASAPPMRPPSKPGPVNFREISKVLSALSFLIAVRELQAGNVVFEVTGASTNTWRFGRPSHGVTDAMNCVVEFLQGIE